MPLRKSAMPAIALVATVFVGASCASKPPEDVVVRGSVSAAEDLNPDTEGRASPLVVKIYQLKARDKFEAADLFPLLDNAETELAGDLLSMEDMMLTPGEVRAYEGEFDPQTRYIGVVGAYRDANQAQWKDIVEMPEKSLLKLMKRGAIKISAQSLAINVSVDD